MKQDVEIHIDELVLHGFESSDPECIKLAVETELARLFAEKGLPGFLSQPKMIRGLPSGQFTLQPAAKAGTIGNHIATSVYNSFTPPKSAEKK